MSAAADRFAEELAVETDPQRKDVLAAIVRLLRNEPVRVPADGSVRLATVSALATEVGIDRFHFSSAERGRHNALAKRYLAAARSPEALPAAEARLLKKNKQLETRVDNLKEELGRARRTVELTARALRILTAENAALRSAAEDAALRSAAEDGQAGRLRAVPRRDG